MAAGDGIGRGTKCHRIAATEPGNTSNGRPAGSARQRLFATGTVWAIALLYPRKHCAG